MNAIIQTSIKILNSRTFQLFVLLSVLALIYTSPDAFALTKDDVTSGTATDPKFVSGGVKLANHIFGWMLLGIPVTCGGIFGWHAWQKSMAEEGGEVASRNKSMKRVLIWGPVAFGGDALVKLVFYYLVNNP